MAAYERAQVQEPKARSIAPGNLDRAISEERLHMASTIEQWVNGGVTDARMRGDLVFEIPNDSPTPTPASIEIARQAFGLLAESLPECAGISAPVGALQPLSWFNRNWVIALADKMGAFQNLQHLSLGRTSTDDDGLKALAASALLMSNIRTLSLPYTAITDNGLIELTQSAFHLPNLASLCLDGTAITDCGLAALAANAARLPNLRKLRLDYTNVGDTGLMTFHTNASRLPNLRNVGLSNTRASDAGLKAFAANLVNMPRLKILDLDHTHLGDDGIRALAANALYLQHLVELNLNGTQVGDKGLAALASNSSHLIHLKELHLRSTSVGDEGVRALVNVDGRGWPSLEKFNLSSTRVTDDSIRLIAENASKLPRLWILWLDRTLVTDDGLKRLAEVADRFPHLDTLFIDNIPCTLPEVVSSRWHDAKAIFKYIMERRQDGRRVLGEIKLIVLGQAFVGKSHLVKRCFPEYHSNNRTYYDETEPRTHDVRRTEEGWGLRELSGEQVSVKVHVWDFGGQNDLHSTHRFFLGIERCFYLLVLRADWPGNGEQAESNRLTYWLRMIAHQGRASLHASKKGPPLLIAVTQCDRLCLESTDVFKGLARALQEAESCGWYGANVVAKPIISRKTWMLPSRGRLRSEMNEHVSS
jgi:Ran GTPase-activating protein (RanGAP) involved in mRNA processing and transport